VLSQFPKDQEEVETVHPKNTQINDSVCGSKPSTIRPFVK
jgi:hypothetical protein